MSELGTNRVGKVNSAQAANKYLTFVLGAEQYGVEILKVREIIGVMEITVVPHTPPFLKGVVNLRGRVIPIIDLRLKFGMDGRDYDERTCIIVVDVQGGAFLVGMIVDSVSEVLNVGAGEIESPPSFGAQFGDLESILGMAKVNDEVTILVDVDKVVGEGIALQFREN